MRNIHASFVGTRGDENYVCHYEHDKKAKSYVIPTLNLFQGKVQHDMKEEKRYYVYILTNKSNKVLYIGMTNDIARRMFEHKTKLVEGFTKKYNLTKLVYCEATNDVESAIRREKQLKNWHRDWKINLINQFNPEWKDLSEEF